jgi:hypothetical protein
VRDFTYVLPVFIFFVGLKLLAKKRNILANTWIMLDCLIWISAWTAIMLPWHSTLEYYLLPASLAVSILAGVGIIAMVKHLRDASRAVKIFAGIMFVCAFVLMNLIFANGITNGRIQITIDSSNMDMIDFLASHVPVNGTVLVNLPEGNEYVFEIWAHLAALKGRHDIQVRSFNSVNFATDAGAVVATPIMENQPIPSFRVAMHEADARLWKSELEAKLGSRRKLVYQNAKNVQLLLIALEKPICPVLIRANVREGVYCEAERPLIDTRVFTYGWEVFTIS